MKNNPIFRILLFLFLFLFCLQGCSAGEPGPASSALPDSLGLEKKSVSSILEEKEENSMYQPAIVRKKPEDGVLKILSIGNSFSDDMMEYTAQIALDAGYTVSLGNLHIGGCNLERHVFNAQNDLAAYDYRTTTNGVWTTVSSTKMCDALSAEDWDFITFQQSSGLSGMADTYSDAAVLADYVRQFAPNAQFVWHMTWAYQQNSTHADFAKYGNDQLTMYYDICSCVSEMILPDERFTAVCPSGTAIQNARSASVFGDTLTRDGFHLAIPHGRYAAGLMLCYTVCDMTAEDLLALSYAPSGITADQDTIIKQAVLAAAESPLVTTKIS